MRDPRLTTEVERRLTVAELRQLLAQPITDDEREHAEALIRWFTRRYPSGAARLAYVRQAYQRWTRHGDG